MSSNAAYDPELQATVMVLQNLCHGFDLETWTWDGIRFSRLAGQQSEDNYYNTESADPLELVYEESTHRMLMIDASGRVWELQGESWIKVTLSGPAKYLGYGFSACYYPERESIIAFGGWLDNAGTWEFKNDSWQRFETVHSPPVRLDHRLVCDRARGNLVLFGGYYEDCSNETWLFDGVDWTLVDCATQPSFRSGMAMVYDESKDSVILAGGRCGYDMVGDVWRFDGISWIRDETSGIKPKRAQAASAYDPLRHCLIICGGKSGEEFRGSLLECSYE
jgi:hypothetical protein